MYVYPHANSHMCGGCVCVYMKRDASKYTMFVSVCTHEMTCGVRIDLVQCILDKAAICRVGGGGAGR